MQSLVGAAALAGVLGTTAAGLAAVIVLTITGRAGPDEMAGNVIVLVPMAVAGAVLGAIVGLGRAPCPASPLPRGFGNRTFCGGAR